MPLIIDRMSAEVEPERATPAEPSEPAQPPPTPQQQTAAIRQQLRRYHQRQARLAAD